MANEPQDIILLVGTLTENSASEGIYCYRMNPSSGELSLAGIIKGIRNPSFLALHPGGRFLYSTSEVENFHEEEGGGAYAFSVAPDALGFTFLNHQPTRGKNPCYISIEQTGRFALTANYADGSLTMLPIQPDGKLGKASDFVQHSGSGSDPDRQDGPHAHCILPDPTNHFALAADLGIDQLLIYRMDLEAGKLIRHTAVKTKPGAGPRHLAFHPGGKFVYLINELDSTLTVYRYLSDTGNLEELETVSTLPEGFQGWNITADIHVSPSGKYLYGSNRGHDSLVAFEINEGTGHLSYLSHTPSHGKEPQNFVIDPNGNFLLAANQKSDNIVIFRISAENGPLLETGLDVKVPMPSCLKFIRQSQLPNS